MKLLCVVGTELWERGRLCTTYYGFSWSIICQRIPKPKAQSMLHCWAWFPPSSPNDSGLTNPPCVLTYLPVLLWCVQLLLGFYLEPLPSPRFPLTMIIPAINSLMTSAIFFLIHTSQFINQLANIKLIIKECYWIFLRKNMAYDTPH